MAEINPPWRLDPLQNIINVSWGGKGAISVVGVEVADSESEFGRIYRGESKSTKGADGKIKPMEWKTEIESSTLAFRSSSYALVSGEQTTVGKSIIEVGGTPVFLMGGGWVSLGQIHRSNDAKTWSTVSTHAHVGGSGFTGIVWDPQARAFFATSIMRQDGEDIIGQVQLWKSPDGSSWSQETELTAPDADQALEDEATITGMLLSHATKPENVEGKVPDGYAGYDPKKDILIKPTGLNNWNVSGPDLSGLGSSVTIEGGDNAGTKSLPVDIVWGVSFAGGVWTALGVRQYEAPTFQKPSVVFCSTDDGQTWTEVFERAGYFPAGIISGAKKDVTRFKNG